MQAMTNQLADEEISSFSCSLCFRTFDTKKSQVRHSSYCRKRARNPPRPRKRSCFSCTKAKTSCDATLPACSRCRQKGVVCEYQSQPQTKQPTDFARPLPTSVILPPDQSLSLDSFSDSFSLTHIDLPVDNVADDPTPVWTEALMINDDYVSQYSNIFDDVPDLLTSLPGSFKNGPNSFGPIIRAKSQLEMPVLSNLGKSIPSPSTDFFYPLHSAPILQAPRAFRPKKARNRYLSLIRRFVVCTIGEYPSAMLPGRGFPPFIHPKCLNGQPNGRSTQSSILRPLATCSGIVAMWSMKNNSNVGFIWSAIRTEQERLLEESFAYDDWNAVAALQAICVYLILRFSERNEDVTNFDIPLIHTMMKLVKRVQGISMKHCNPLADTIPRWESWTLVESLRRTILLVFIIELLFDMSPGTQNDHKCQNFDLIEILLPSTKNLWAARTRSEWERDYITEQAIQRENNSRGLNFHDMLRHNTHTSKSENLVDYWLSHVDEFGTLVMAAASLTGIID